ncbi:MAG: hypothetical protein NZM09_09735 [Ignavibacterium sp.]|nr:hypothetical protein [Ignavibacterium sp.]MCX7611230.1 hypothetical protein [Ignavibacterium sp.]MDW8375958.1 hypothetical protein [Ignavibacteriales bacterium]
MNQLLDILSSFLIGGILLLALVGLNMQFTSKYQEIKLAEITQSTSTNIGQVIENDFNKIGYGNNVDTSIVSISKNAITFKADIDNNGQIEVVNYSVIRNNNGTFLKRTLNRNESRSWTQPINTFEIYGISNSLDTTYVINNISSILLNVIYAKTDYYQDTTSIGIQWRRVFYPKNLIK